MSACFLTHFLHHLKDEDIRPLASESLELAHKRLERIRGFFREERFPMPAGFTEDDVKLDAPPLFRDTFTLSFIYMMNRLGMINYAFTASNNVRLDVLDFFDECLRTSNEMFGKAVRLMLEKGIYDRPPKMNYPEKIEFIHKGSFLNGLFGKQRPLNAIELSDMFFNIERNYFSVIIMLGFAQVVKDKQLKQFLLRGKKISEEQIRLINGLMMDEGLLGNVTTTMEVTDSTESPFSERLIMTLVTTLNAVDIVLLSHALALAMRTDLAVHYTKYIATIAEYAKETFDLMVDREWLEQPPLTTDRAKLIGK